MHLEVTVIVSTNTSSRESTDQGIHMKKNLILLAAAAYLATTAVDAAEPAVLITPNHYRAAHAVPLATSAHRSAAVKALQTASAPAFNVHVALWRSFDVPAAVNGTTPASINGLGEVTGSYTDSNGNIHGFLRKAGGEIVTFDAPHAAGATLPNCINNEGDIVGNYNDASGASHGFIRWAHGRFTIIDDPSSTLSPPSTIPQAINDFGEVVGYYYDSSGNYHGFVRRSSGSFTTVEPPGAAFSQAYHINNRGEVGGDWSDAVTGASHGMLLYPNGKLVTFDAPNAVLYTFGGLGQALNFEGSFAGTYADANLGAHGYVRYANDKFVEFTAPGGGTDNFNGTWAASLNLLGTVVGFSYEPDGTTVDGYVRFADGTLILANAPVVGQQATYAWAINDLNEFTGVWVDSQGAEHGFVALAVP
jgi:hypothetical protein